MSDRHFFPCGNWAENRGSLTRIGLSKKAVHLLGEISHVQLPRLNSLAERDEVVVVLETCKAALDIEAPMDGMVVSINSRLIEDPDLLNQDPEGDGWLYEIDSAVSQVE
jgi:glycine cleavage system H protein